LSGFEQSLKTALADVLLKHVDETGTRVSGKLHWFHVRCTQSYCYLFRHEKRGGDAVADLLSYTGTRVSGFWSSYVTLGCKHVFCGTHILRELTFVAEVLKQPWAASLIAESERAGEGCHAVRERGASPGIGGGG
jgi:transposase